MIVVSLEVFGIVNTVSKALKTFFADYSPVQCFLSKKVNSTLCFIVINCKPRNLMNWKIACTPEKILPLQIHWVAFKKNILIPTTKLEQTTLPFQVPLLVTGSTKQKTPIQYWLKYGEKTPRRKGISSKISELIISGPNK